VLCAQRLGGNWLELALFLRASRCAALKNDLGDVTSVEVLKKLL
jgi:hypothetical protein